MEKNDSSVRIDQSTETSDRLFALWGFQTDDLYRIALRFFKEKDGSKAVPISCKEKIRLIALSKQVSFGKFEPQAAVEIGLFDVVGNDRKLAWKKLDDMPKDAAMCEFISSVNNLCPLFEPYITAHKVEREDQERKKKEEVEEINRRIKQQMEEEEMKIEEDWNRRMNQEMMIRVALNQQTDFQFRSYAEQQLPGNSAQQEYLIAQLQDQHFAQYMMQVYNQQGVSSAAMPSSQLAEQTSGTSSLSASSLVSQSQQMPSKMASSSLSHVTTSSMSQSFGSPSSGHTLESDLANGSGPQDNNKNLISTPGHVTSSLKHEKQAAIEAASLWTRRDVHQFKQSLRGETESLFSVRSGETVTVRIPTHEDGSCLFWEFATEAYDIGFGVSFEWTNTPSNQLTVEVSNSDMNEDKSEPQWHNTPPTDVIIPVYRRDSHAEVYCGSHVYPGRGVYLFVFDNSYSLWRSKAVFYRVYYTR